MSLLLGVLCRHLSQSLAGNHDAFATTSCPCCSPNYCLDALSPARRSELGSMLVRCPYVTPSGTRAQLALTCVWATSMAYNSNWSGDQHHSFESVSPND